MCRLSVVSADAGSTLALGGAASAVHYYVVKVIVGNRGLRDTDLFLNPMHMKMLHPTIH